MHPTLSRAVALTLLAASAWGQTTVASGAWTDPTIWDTGLVPGPADDVVVSAGTTVGLVPVGMATRPVRVESLRVDGALTSTFPAAPNAQPLRIVTPTFVNHGTVRSNDGGGGKAGNLWISCRTVIPGIPAPFLPAGGTFENHGTIEAGDGAIGGDVFVYYVNGTALNEGTISGGDGDRGGNAHVHATSATNAHGGVVEGGDSTDLRAGDAEVLAYSLPPGAAADASNLADSEIRGGDAAGTGRGGDATMQAWALPPAAGIALNGGSAGPGTTTALLRGGNGCAAGVANLLGMVVVNRGRVRPGTPIPANCPPPPPPRIRADPPEGFIEGEAQLQGAIIELVAADYLFIGNLVHPFAIQAEQELIIQMAPGGVLDLSQAGPNTFAAGGSVQIFADQVLLPPGLVLQDLTPSPVFVLPGQESFLAGLGPDLVLEGSRGGTVELPVVVRNEGTAPLDVLVEFVAPPSLVGLLPPPIQIPLEPMQLVGLDPIQVPIPPALPVGALQQIELRLTALPPVGAPILDSQLVDVVVGADLCAVEPYALPYDMTHVFETAVAATGDWTVYGGPAGGPGLLGISTGPNGILFPPGVLGFEPYVDYTSIALWQPIVLDPLGEARLPLSLVHPPLSAGLTLHTQALVLDPSDLSLRESNGLASTFCP